MLITPSQYSSKIKKKQGGASDSPTPVNKHIQPSLHYVSTDTQFFSTNKSIILTGVKTRNNFSPNINDYKLRIIFVYLGGIDARP